MKDKDRGLELEKAMKNGHSKDGAQRLAEEAVPGALVPRVQLVPRCPYCGTDPAKVQTTLFQLNPVLMGVAIFCGTEKCRKLWNVQLLPPEPQVAQPSPTGSLIVVP